MDVALWHGALSDPIFNIYYLSPICVAICRIPSPTRKLKAIRPGRSLTPPMKFNERLVFSFTYLISRHCARMVAILDT
jgi:hypothetical protein